MLERRTKETYSSSRDLLGSSRCLWDRLSNGSGLGDGLDSLNFLDGSSNGRLGRHYKRGFERSWREKRQKGVSDASSGREGADQR